MEYRKIGSSGLRVSPICVGTAFRGLWSGRGDEQTCMAVIDRAVEAGLNFFDCANFYQTGRCEEILGRALQRRAGLRDQLVITSKVESSMGEGPNDSGLSRYHIMREIDRSLQRLLLDHIDIYLLHHFSPDTEMAETLRAMDDLVHAGKIRYYGICNFRPAQVVEALWICDRMGLEQPLVLQNQYNLLHRVEVEPELIPLCRRFGLGLMTYSAVGVGLLTGQFRKGQKPPTGTLWARQSSRFDEVMTEGVDRIVQELAAIGAELGKSLAQIAIAWILDQEGVSSAMIGPDLPEQVDEALGAVGWSLPVAAKQRLDELSEPDLLG